MENTTTTAAATGINPALLERDYTIIVDESGSMSYPLHSAQPGGLTRWAGAEEAVRAAAIKLNELDPDGITVYSFNQHFTRYDNTTPDKVAQIFKKHSPDGSTKLAEVLDDAFRNFLDRKKAGTVKKNGELIVVATDGEPDDGEKVARVITNCTKQLTNAQELQVIILQVGDDEKATKYLNALDDDLEGAGAKYDIVSVLSMDNLGTKSFSQFLVDAIVEHKITV